MKLSETWLREYSNPNVDIDTLVHQLTMAGLEIDGVHPAAPEFNQVVIAEIISVGQHPDADKLKVCQVDVGEKENLQIVTNVATIKSGMKVALAKIGAKLPDGLEIKKAKLRGILSQGMFGGAETLGLGDVSQGLITFSNDAPVGEDVRVFLKLDDNIISVDLTPNRGDCLSVLGVARDVAAINHLVPPTTTIKEIPASINEQLNVYLDNPEACPRYLGRVIKNINAHAVTPVWMKERLRRVDVRPISPVVDVLNYVMLELGQPMHAFDLEKLQGDLHVRWAEQDEALTLLNGDEVKLHRNTLVIADDKTAHAMAGIMGGLDASVTDDTQHIFLESAFFFGPSIIGRSRCFGLHTESGYRFERGVDFNLPRQAIERATELLLDIVGGDAGPVTETVDEKHLPKGKAIHLSGGYSAKVLGIDIETSAVIHILESLGMCVEQKADELIVHVPSYRFDINIAEDLIEEVARIYGYDNIPVSQHVGFNSKVETSLKLTEYRIKLALQGLGYNEAITYSFIPEKTQKLIDPSIKPINLMNPMSSEMAVMRTSLWPGLLAIMQYNLHRQQSRARLFEIGQSFRQVGASLAQENRLAGLVCGSRDPEQWGESTQPVDFFDVKGELEELLSLSGQVVEFKKGNHPALHPGQCAEIFIAGEAAGHLGSLHPSVARGLNIKTNVFLFELSLKAVLGCKSPEFKSISKFPVIRRDFAIVVDEEVLANSLINKAQELMKERLIDHVIFDIFKGEGIGEHKRSIAIGLTLQHPDRTLTDDEVTKLCDQLVTAWQKEFGAVLRD